MALARIRMACRMRHRPGDQPATYSLHRGNAAVAAGMAATASRSRSLRARCWPHICHNVIRHYLRDLVVGCLGNPAVHSLRHNRQGRQTGMSKGRCIQPQQPCCCCNT